MYVLTSSYVIFKYDANGVPFLATFVYASPNPSKRNDLWLNMRSLPLSISEPWVVFGDYNATFSSHDRKGCRSSLPDSDFQHMVFYCGLQDLGYHGPDVTWYRNNCSVRLDRCLGNSVWFECFPNSSLQHLIRMNSNHKPIFLSLHGMLSSSMARSFRYVSGWPFHGDFKRLVLDNWDTSLHLSEAIAKFSLAADSLNREILNFSLNKKNSYGSRKRVLT
ncbi:hypothetical protein V6N13_071635 [Hibiscus sabdariffa]